MNFAAPSCFWLSFISATPQPPSATGMRLLPLNGGVMYVVMYGAASSLASMATLLVPVPYQVMATLPLINDDCASNAGLLWLVKRVSSTLSTLVGSKNSFLMMSA